MSDTPPPDAPPQDDPPPPAAPPEAPAPPAVPEAPEPAPAPLTRADLDSVASDFRQAAADLRSTVERALTPSPSPVQGAGATTPGPTPARKDPRTWLQRFWLGPRRF